ncbi:MAG: hypothetical protein FWC50_01095 [Planctomycetaceae bacterium]|nr:hypothetical protein [Planctomycetaceae bacterium]
MNDNRNSRGLSGDTPGSRTVAPPPLQPPTLPSTLPATSDIVNRAVWEPYFRFLLFFASIWRNWYWSIPLGIILGGCLGALGFLTTTLYYPSQAWIHIHYQRRFVAFPDLNLPREEYLMFVSTQIVLFHSDMVIRPAWAKIVHDAKSEGIDIRSLLKMNDPIQWLTRRLQITADENSQVHVVSFETSDPRLSQFILESILSSYFDYLKRSSTDSTSGLITDLKRYAENKRADIEALNREYELLIKRIIEGGGRIPSDKDMQMEYDTLYNDAAMIDAEIEAKKVELEYNKKAVTREVNLPDAVVEALVYSDKQMIELLSEKYTLLDRLERKTKLYANPNDPIVLAAQKAVDDVNKRIEDLSIKLLPDAKLRWIAGIRQDAQTKVMMLEEEIRSLERMGTTLQDRRQEKLVVSSTLSQAVIEATNLKFKILREEEVYNTLLARINVLTTENNAPSRVEQLSQRATVTEFPDTSKRNRTAVIYGMAGFMFAVALGWGRESLSARFYHLMQLHLLYPDVMLREIHGMPRPGLKNIFSSRSAQLLKQSVEEVCNDFCFGKNFQGVKTLMLSSIRLDDGQSLLAVRIAEKMTQMKKEPVLLIDAHFQNNRVMNLLGIDSIRGGLADVLAMRLSINDAILRVDAKPNLHFLPASTSDLSDIEFYGDGKMKMLLAELARHYSMVIITAPPFRVSSGTYTLATHVDATAVVLRLYDTNRSQTEKAYRQLCDINAGPNGFLVAGVSDRA